MELQKLQFSKISARIMVRTTNKPQLGHFSSQLSDNTIKKKKAHRYRVFSMEVLLWIRLMKPTSTQKIGPIIISRVGLSVRRRLNSVCLL